MKPQLLITTSMTPAERAQGRYLRAPDGHPEPAAPPAAEPTAEAVPAAPPAAEPKTIDDLYNEEFGTVEPETPAAGEGDEGEEEPETPPAPEPKGAPTQEELDELASRNRQLERDLEEARRAAKPAEPPKEENQPAENKAPNPADYEFGAADERFLADHARWHAEQRFAELQEGAEIQARISAIETKWNEQITTDPIKEAYPDFDTVVTKGADNKTWACSPAMALLIKNSDVGPHVAYALATNAEESRRIASLSPEEQLLEFGRLEGRALAKAEAATAAPPPPPPKRVSQTPPPPAARSRGSGGQFASEQDALYDQMLREF